MVKKSGRREDASHGEYSREQFLGREVQPVRKNPR